MEKCGNCRHWSYISGVSGECSYLSHYHDNNQVNSNVCVSEDFYCIEWVTKVRLRKKHNKDKS